jgi:hypothetical protein
LRDFSFFLLSFAFARCDFILKEIAILTVEAAAAMAAALKLISFEMSAVATNFMTLVAIALISGAAAAMATALNAF